jgi:hypothetical protein
METSSISEGRNFPIDSSGNERRRYRECVHFDHLVTSRLSFPRLDFEHNLLEVSQRTDLEIRISVKFTDPLGRSIESLGRH